MHRTILRVDHRGMVWTSSLIPRGARIATFPARQIPCISFRSLGFRKFLSLCSQRRRLHMYGDVVSQRHVSLYEEMAAGMWEYFHILKCFAIDGDDRSLCVLL